MRNVGYFVLAVLVAVAISACGDDNTQTPDGTSSLQSTSTASGTPATAGDEAFPAGTHTTEGFGVPVTLTVGEGWKRPVDNSDIFVVEHPLAADGPFGYIAFLLPTQVYNPSESTLDLGQPPGDFVEWLTSHRLFQIVDTQAITLGSIEGSQFEITTDTFSDFPLFKLSDGDYELRFRDHIRMVVLELAASQLLVTYGSDLPADFDNFEPMAEEVLATVEFGE